MFRTFGRIGWLAQQITHRVVVLLVGQPPQDYVRRIAGTGRLAGLVLDSLFEFGTGERGKVTDPFPQ